MVVIYFIICGVVWSTQTKSSQYDCEKHTGFPSCPLLLIRQERAGSAMMMMISLIAPCLLATAYYSSTVTST